MTKLLVSTKQLLEGLTEWSQGKISEEQVSDIYVRLGNCFNSAVAAFTREGISMRCATYNWIVRQKPDVPLIRSEI